MTPLPTSLPTLLTAALRRAGWWVGVALLGINGSHAATPSIGLPITRAYSIEEIGITRGPHLNFDQLGRLAVIGGGSYIVLNDGAWLDLHDQRPGAPIFLDVLHAPDGKSYFGALALWGFAEMTEKGRFEAVPLRPDEYPAWVNSTNFTDVVPISDGVLFSGINGIVYIRTSTGEQQFFEIPEIALTFTLGDHVYVSSHVLGTLKLDPATGTIETIDATRTIHVADTLQDGRIIAGTIGSSLLHFDGERFTDTGIRFNDERMGQISALQALPDGGFAVALDGLGLYLFSGSGDCRMALTSIGYRRIYDLATREPGVLWIAMESSIEKLLYNDPVSVVDQRSDVVIGWPQVVQWGERAVIASNGRLYDMVLSSDGRNHDFVEVRDTPIAGAWAVAANARHMLVGNNDGVFMRTADGFVAIPGMPGASRLYFQEDDLCIVVNSREIAAIRWHDGRWSECAERLPGVGFPSVALPTPHALWVELGLDRAARIWFADGALHTRVYNHFPWSEPSWINIGAIDRHVVLSGAHNQRVYVDDVTGEIVPDPALESLLARVHVTVLRVVKDARDTIWITHPNGVMTLHSGDDGYRLDSESLGSIRDLYPVITLLSDNGAWISTESALYHVARDLEPYAEPAARPFLVSIRDGKSGVELYSATRRETPMDALPYSRNHLEFRYFSGGYIHPRNPTYEFSMKSGSTTWNLQSAESVLKLPQLEEGHYQLTARALHGDRVIGDPVVTMFTIRPPWYRSPLAYAGYWGAGGILCASIVAWVLGRAKRKQAYLEQLVRERTEELRATMDKLTEEARTSATLAERNRLAGEIHDSLQQGLSGLALHLETTLRKDSLEPDIRCRLSVASRMVSFTRQEVQQAVWDLESPLLQSDTLGPALRKLADLIGNETTEVTVDVQGVETTLSSTVQHHLLRIAQEAITNAVRHSAASHVRVMLGFHGSTVRLAVEDNGRGFAPDEVLAGGIGHFGLRGMRARAAKVQGDLSIRSAPGQGTEVSISVPIQIDSASNAESRDQHPV